MNDTKVRFILEGAAEEDLARIVIAALSDPEVSKAVAVELGLNPSPTLLTDMVEQIEKALKPGGPAHAGRSLRQVAKDRRLAISEAGTVRADMANLLRDDKDAALQLVTLLGEARRAPGNEQKTLECDKIRGVIERDLRTAIRNSYRRTWKLGREAAGNFGPMSVDERRALSRIQLTEQQFAVNMLADIYAGTYRMDLDQRIEMYRRSAERAFWYGFLMADLSPGRYVKWVLNANGAGAGAGAAEHHCGDCPKIAKGGRWRNGVYLASELAKRGLVPKCSLNQCWGACDCGLKDVPKPKGVATGKPLSALVLEGPNRSASFEGQGRQDREKFVRGTKRNGWYWKRRIKS